MDKRDDTMGQWETIRDGEGAPWQTAPGKTFGSLPTMRDGAGVVLAGRYKVLKRLGEGGMGSVWLAEDAKLDNRKVAVKMLPAILAGKKGAYRQVKAEALMAMKLSHSNIATVRSFEEDEGGNPFLVMDYIEGEPLDDILAERGPLGEEETVRLLGPVAAALDYAHSQGVVHRDVKPGNVMVRKDGVPFVLDFGIAREVQETMTMVTGKMSSGTLLYMSPEQLRGKGPKAAQDVYSFAAMAYECLAGRPPFSRGQIEWQIVNEAPEELPGNVGAGLRKGVMAGLAKEAGNRPGSCAGVLGRDEEDKRAREEAEKREKAKRAEEEAARVRREEALRELERARAEHERRKREQALEEERKAREAAEKEAREAQRAAQQRTREAMEAEAARGRAVGWSVFLAISMLVAGIGTYAWWQGKEQEQKREMGKLRQQVEAAKAARPTTPQRMPAAQPAAPAAPQRTPVAQPVAKPAAPAAPAKAASGTWDGSFEGEVRDVSLPNRETMRLHWCPAGRFTMGSPGTEEGRYNDETQHEVTLTRGFWMAETEVTQGQWKSLMDGGTVADLAKKALQDDTGYDFNDGKGAITMRERWGMKATDDPMNRCGDLDDAVPVYNVSWGEAKEFCRCLTQKGHNEGWLPMAYHFRLPTEAEWEYACRAGTKTALPNGKDIQIRGQNNAPALDDIAWYGGNSSDGFKGERAVDTDSWPEKQYPGGRASARKIRLKEHNRWGLYDMIGNVWEWCEDEFGGYPAGPVTNYLKQNGTSASGVHRVLRGGSWFSCARCCRSALRNWYPAGYRVNCVGFRPVCSAGLSE